MRKFRIGISLLGLILGCFACDMFKWEVIDQEQVGNYCVSVQAQVGSALDREVTEVRLHKTCEDISAGRTLLRFEGMGPPPQLTTIGKDLVAVSRQSGPVFRGELHLVLNLRVISKSVEFSYQDKLKTLRPALRDSTAGVSYRLYQLADRRDVKIMEIGWSQNLWDDDNVCSFPTTGNLVLVGADEVHPEFTGGRDLDLTVTWKGNDDMDSLRIRVPRTRVDSMTVIAR